MLGRKAAPISTLKYIYSSDGMIAGRMIAGKFQDISDNYFPANLNPNENTYNTIADYINRKLE